MFRPKEDTVVELQQNKHIFARAFGLHIFLVSPNVYGWESGYSENGRAKTIACHCYGTKVKVKPSCQYLVG